MTTPAASPRRAPSTAKTSNLMVRVDLPSKQVIAHAARIRGIILAWLGVDQKHHRKGLGTRLLAQALADCFAAGQTFAFVAVILDCIDESAKAFYQRWDFQEMPGRPMRLFLPFSSLEKLMSSEEA